MERKKEWKTTEMISRSILILFDTVQLVILIFNFGPKLKTPIIEVSLKSLTGIKAGRKKEWTNEWNDEKKEPNTLLLSTTSHTQGLYQFQILAIIAPEKSVTEI